MTPGAVPVVVSTFDNMSSATLGLALRADRVSRTQLRYLSLLPALLTRVGVIENGKPVSYEEMSERLRKEILNLNAYFSTNPRTERVELVVRGAGIGANEAKRAIEWMSLVLQHPDWRPENLARIRDVVDQSLSALRNTTQGSEESWVQNPAFAYRVQTNPSYLAADSFLTRGHNALRLRWLLKEAPAADRDALSQWFTNLAQQKGTRAELKAMLAKPETVAGLSASAQAIAKDAVKDLDLTLIEIPDSSLEGDWNYLVMSLRDDLLTPPADALALLDSLRQSLLRRANARMFFVTSTAIQNALAPSVDALASSLNAAAPPTLPPVADTRLVDARLRARDNSATNPVYVGLLAPNMKGGVIITSVPSVHFGDAANKEMQLDYLASRLHSGYGAHGVFLKTLANGLAYSNGLRASVQSGRQGYYAERTPEIPQTVKFVVDTLKSAERDPRLADYAVAQVFGETRAAATYETRAESMAADLADRQPPEQVKAFRQSILELRKDPELGNKLFDRKDAVYGRVLPGYNVKGKDVPGAVYFTIGPDKQLDAWEGYLRGAEGADTKLYRLYARDFWMP
jgi:Zn-dependent M16 (insulinase) family peptidase